jgi:transcriptional regulator with XRE-family HTH domain
LRAARRKYSHSTLAEFAKAIGYSASYLSAVELRHLPETPDVLQAYEMGLGLEPATLFPERTVQGVLGKALQRDRARSRSSRPPGALDSALELLRRAADNAAAPGHIYLTYQTDRDLFEGSEAMFAEWLHVLRACLRRGWSITQVYRMNDDRQRSLQMVEAMIDLLGSKGDYHAVSIPNQQASSPSADFVIVPGIGATMLLTAEGGVDVVTVSDSAGVARLEAHCRRLVGGARPLLTPLSRRDPVRWQRLLDEIESMQGGMVLVRNSLLSLVAPESFYIPGSTYVDRLNLSEERVQELRELAGRRLERMKARLSSDSYVTICPRTAVVQFAESGSWPDDEPGLAPLPLSERLQFLHAMVSALKTYDRFELALIDDTELRWLRPKESDPLLTWMVRGNRVAFLETWPLDDNGVPTNVHIAMHEPSIAGAFADYFGSVWNRIAPVNRTKSSVVEWLEAQCAMLRDGIED